MQLNLSKTILTAAFTITLLSGSVQAAALAFDEAANYTTATWVTSSNLGTGFGAWTLGTALGNQIADSSGNGGTPNINSAGDTAFRIGRTGTGFNQAERSFTAGGPNASSALAVGQSFRFSFDLEVPTTNNQAVGFWLTDGLDGERWGIEIGRTSGGVNQFRFKNNGSAAIISSIPTAGVDNGGNVTFNLLAGGAWNASIEMLGAGGATYNVASTDAGFSSLNASPTGFRFFFANSPTGQSQYFNNFAVVPEPSGILLLGLSTLGMLLKRRR